MRLRGVRVRTLEVMKAKSQREIFALDGIDRNAIETIRAVMLEHGYRWVEGGQHIMQMVDFDATHIEQAMQIALQNYEEARGHVPALPPMDAVPDLTLVAENGFGVAAVEGGIVLGFLCAVGPFENAFRSTAAVGVFSPLGVNGAIWENRADIYARMYQAAGEKWVQAGATSHAICLYAHDKELREKFFRCGFGIRCVDAIRPMEEIIAQPRGLYYFRELTREEYRLILPLKKLLDEHMGKSPAFMCYSSINDKELLKMVTQPNVRYYAAERDGQIVAYIKISDDGENFACNAPGMKNICGAYCLPEYRGTGMFQQLLNFTMRKLQIAGYTLLGVDFESINPTAYGFWLKYFEAYTYSVVRRIDEHAVCLP